MPVKIRLQRKGKTDQPMYRIVASDQRFKANGKVLEVIGTVNPNIKPQGIKYDKAKLDLWISKGAQISNTVRKMISS